MISKIVAHHNPHKLPQTTNNVIPIQLYGKNHLNRLGLSYIGNPLTDSIRRLGIRLSSAPIDFLTIALVVTAADTFIARSQAGDGWSREIEIDVSLWKPDPWINVKSKLERALHFLSGDIWSIQFRDSGFKSPIPYSHRKGYRLNLLYPSNCVCLFSGGLDSAVGAIDLLDQGLKPTLVSHAYPKDSLHQDLIALNLEGRFSRFSLNADPHSALHTATEISMRTRSLNFLAFGVIACDAVMQINKFEPVDLYVPENGFISLNAPLTPRRIGSFSTRTTHPYFLSLIQEIFDEVGIKVQIKNPYQFLTKGEMILNCRNSSLLQALATQTVSCSHWKRKNKQCGYCVPCIIRRSALFHGNLDEISNYQVNDLKTLKVEKLDDLFALQSAIYRAKHSNIESWISKSGILPTEQISDFESIFLRGLHEIENYLIFQQVNQ